MLEESDIDILKKYKKGKANTEEEKLVYSLFADNENNSKFKKLIRKEFDLHTSENFENNEDVSYILDRIHHTIHKKESIQRQSVARKIYNWYSVAAAILLLPIIIAGVLWFSNQNQPETIVVEAPVSSTLIAPFGSRITFTLPDGTKGWLNSGSSLTYNQPFNRNRQVDLEGEVWLNVSHDEEHPFIVNTGSSNVKVLGTKFNLNAYPEENYVEVVLEEGKVSFNTGGLQEVVVLKPNERLVLENNKINIDQIEPYKYSAWKEGKLVFRDDSMDEVARRIERWYNVDVELVEKELKSYVFRGTFQDDSLEEVLRYLSMTSPIKYKIEGRKELTDGTVLKKKIFLYKKK